MDVLYLRHLWDIHVETLTKNLDIESRVQERGLGKKKQINLRDVSTYTVLKAMRLVEIPSFEEKRGPKSEPCDTVLFR